jgi:hypothetical protein
LKSFLWKSSVDAVSKDKKWSVTGVRYATIAFGNSQETQTNFTPSFADIQTNINFRLQNGNGVF